jgi:chemotaxis-related protein WspB
VEGFVQLLSFAVGPNRYAVDVARVVELVPRVALRLIPHAPAYLAGLLAYRGKVVPVIELGLLLGAVPCRARLSTRIILVNNVPIDQNCNTQGGGISGEDRGRPPPDRERAQTLLGLVAEDVSVLNEVTSEQLCPAPVRMPQQPYLGGIIQTDQGILQLIAVEEVWGALLEGGDFLPAVTADPNTPARGMNEGIEGLGT